MIQIPDEKRIREIAREEAARPLFVHQRIVEAVVGLPARDYLIAARAQSFDTTKQRRLVIARTADVAAWLELRMRTSNAPAANDADSETLTLARVGARRVGT